MLPFSIEQFLDVFQQYNEAVYPAQLFLIFAALAAIFLLLRNYRYSSKIIAVILAVFWLWSGVVYHILFFAAINRAALVFGAVFIFQAVLILYFGIWNDYLRFRFTPDRYGIIGAAIVFYALFLYPLLGFLMGHSYPRMPTFGVPCPVTIFTFGILFWSERKVPRHILIVPVIWSVFGIFAAVYLGIMEDLGLPAAAALSLGLLVQIPRYNIPRQNA